MADTTLDARATKFDRSLDSNRVYPSGTHGPELDLTIDVYEQRGNVIAKMALPGMDPDDLEVAVDEDTLRISGVHQEEKETRDKGYINKVVHSESFSRTVDLPTSVDSSRASAEYKDGILQVTIPVMVYTKAKAVIVNVQS